MRSSPRASLSSQELYSSLYIIVTFDLDYTYMYIYVSRDAPVELFLRSSLPHVLPKQTTVMLIDQSRLQSDVNSCSTLAFSAQTWQEFAFNSIDVTRILKLAREAT